MISVKNIYLIGFLFLLIILGGYLYLNKTGTKNEQVQPPSQTLPKDRTIDNQPKTSFSTPKKSAHYETNTPSHGAILASVPINIVIDFNFDLTKPSEIKILKNNKDYGVGETIIDKNILSMRRNMDPNSPDGVYKVEYNACWPDKSCHDGYFEFEINKTLIKDYQDLRGQSKVMVKLSEISFKPQNILISKGTLVEWVNDEQVEHYINSDSHPAHSYYPAQNSKALKNKETFSLNFNSPGIYPYHCSAHASNMIGSIVVE